MGADSATVQVNLTALQGLVNDGLNRGVIPAQMIIDLALANGTSDGQIDLCYAVYESGKAASTVFSYDLSGSLTNKVGASCVFAEVVLIAVWNKRTTALAYLDVGPHATNGFGRLSSSRGFWPADAAADADQGSIVAPDSWLILYNKDGVPVTAGTGDILRITTSGVAGSTNEWMLVVLGRSA